MGVGELSRVSGLSIRVLCLSLGEHGPADGRSLAQRTHRRYEPEQGTRVYPALALRRAGLGLSQIAALLDRHDPDQATTVRDKGH